MKKKLKNLIQFIFYFLNKDSFKFSVLKSSNCEDLLIKINEKFKIFTNETSVKYEMNKHNLLIKNKQKR